MSRKSMMNIIIFWLSTVPVPTLFHVRGYHSDTYFRINCCILTIANKRPFFFKKTVSTNIDKRLLLPSLSEAEKMFRHAAGVIFGRCRSVRGGSDENRFLFYFRAWTRRAWAPRRLPWPQPGSETPPRLAHRHNVFLPFSVSRVSLCFWIVSYM